MSRIEERHFVPQPGGLFAAKVEAWGPAPTPVTVQLPEQNGACLAECLPALQEWAAWLQTARPLVEQALVNGLLGDEDSIYALAEDWTASAQEDEAAEGEECYLVEEGQATVCLPLTPESFLRTVQLQKVEIVFATPEESRAKLVLHCRPDYFDGHPIAVEVEPDKTLRSAFLEG